MTTIKFAPRAKRDLEDVLVYLTEMAGEGTTQKYAGEFADAVDLIQTMPAMGALRPRLGENIRAILFYPTSCSIISMKKHSRCRFCEYFTVSKTSQKTSWNDKTPPSFRCGVLVIVENQPYF